MSPFLFLAAGACALASAAAWLLVMLLPGHCCCGRLPQLLPGLVLVMLLPQLPPDCTLSLLNHAGRALLPLLPPKKSDCRSALRPRGVAAAGKKTEQTAAYKL
jgi:hypothetical protein